MDGWKRLVSIRLRPLRRRALVLCRLLDATLTLSTLALLTTWVVPLPWPQASLLIAVAILARALAETDLGLRGLPPINSAGTLLYAILFQAPVLLVPATGPEFRLAAAAFIPFNACAATWIPRWIQGLVRRSKPFLRETRTLVVRGKGRRSDRARRVIATHLFSGYRVVPDKPLVGEGGAAGDDPLPDAGKLTVLEVGARFLEIDGGGSLDLEDRPAPGINGPGKRAWDLLFGAILLTLLLVPMALIAILVGVSSKGPVIYTQLRITRGGRTFRLIKFRSMRADAEARGPTWALPDDPRQTRLGRVLRHLWLDELPQLLNVVKGDLSLVGPRPERPEFAQEFQKLLPKYGLRHEVRAGITGLAQVSGYAGNTSIRRRLARDLHYIRHWTPCMDLSILALTIIRLFRRRRVPIVRFSPGSGNRIS